MTDSDHPIPVLGAPVGTDPIGTSDRSFASENYRVPDHIVQIALSAWSMRLGILLYRGL